MKKRYKPLLLLSIVTALSAQPKDPHISLSFDGDLSAAAGTTIEGTINGTPTFVDGLDGKALAFSTNGERQAVALDGYIPKFNADSDLSIQLWFKTSQSQDDQPVIMASKDFVSGDYNKEVKAGFALFMHKGTWAFNLGQDVRVKNLWVGKDTITVNRLNYLRENSEYLPINDDKWHQFTLTYNNTKKTVRLYFDGKNCVTYKTTQMAEFASDKALILGADADGSSDNSDRFDGAIDEFALWERELSAEEVHNSYREYATLPSFPYKDNLKELRVGVWNTMEGGTGIQGYPGLAQTAKVINDKELDIVLIQENYSAGDHIAAQTGYYFVESADRDYRKQGANVAIHSRFPVEQIWGEDEIAFYHLGAKIQISKTQYIFVASNWYPGGGKDMGLLFDMHRDNLNAKDSIPFLWGGDFNQNARAGYNCKDNMIEEGFIDAYRDLYPDASTHPGYSYSNSRIDFLYYRGAGIKPSSFEIVNSFPGGFPSDHNLLICDFELDYVTSEGGVDLFTESQKIAAKVPFTYQVSTGFHFSDGALAMELLTARGQRVFQKSLSHCHSVLASELNSSLSPGVYLLRVQGVEKDFIQSISIR